MKALTLKQPWAWAVAHAGKDVENRTWKPPASVIGQRIAIHAGKARERGALRGYGIEVPLFLDQGAIVALATIGGCVGMEASCFNRWLDGPYGWILTDVIAIPEPIPCRGNQGLWTVPADIEAEINRQVHP